MTAFGSTLARHKPESGKIKDTEFARTVGSAIILAAMKDGILR